MKWLFAALVALNIIVFGGMITHRLNNATTSGHRPAIGTVESRSWSRIPSLVGWSTLATRSSTGSLAAAWPRCTSPRTGAWTGAWP